jgi:hypothetical protein
MNSTSLCSPFRADSSVVRDHVRLGNGVGAPTLHRPPHGPGCRLGIPVVHHPVAGADCRSRALPPYRLRHFPNRAVLASGKTVRGRVVDRPRKPQPPRRFDEAAHSNVHGSSIMESFHRLTPPPVLKSGSDRLHLFHGSFDSIDKTSRRIRHRRYGGVHATALGSDQPSRLWSRPRGRGSERHRRESVESTLAPTFAERIPPGLYGTVQTRCPVQVG